ncbi:PDZ and LIM domain protein Zasp isoform X3 [Coccinella septempunctata]|uniref:PDZ and LIM domain protein Zasp isoform X3 n=1 Tax=Coccinella septempunctata TaxID=41139 RepID=UPI001D085D79|nr:PDZ and LIM domain protein Zasp isoform X3 [Coccinella septempunctata]
MGKVHEFLVTLRRNSPTEQWGFSLVGGADVQTPLIVTRVGFGSPADGVLQRGDIISKVGNYDARDIRHQDAQNLFKNSGNNIRVVVQRDTSVKHPTSTGSSRTSSHNYSPLSVSPHLSPRGTSSTYSPGGSALTPYYSSPLPPIDDNYFDVLDYTPGSHKRTEDGEIHVTKQVANSVLDRLSTGDPNKQIVHKQFNSPLPLYSEPNVVDTIRKQTGVSPIKKSVKFNPAESETYKAIQEEQLGQEVHELKPAPTKVYTPQAKKSTTVNQHPPYANSIGQDDVIHQSGSFRRLMMSVLPETSY